MDIMASRASSRWPFSSRYQLKTDVRLPKVSGKDGNISPYHADIVSVQQDLGQLVLGTGVIAAAVLIQTGRYEDSREVGHTTQSHLPTPYLGEHQQMNWDQKARDGDTY